MYRGEEVAGLHILCTVRYLFHHLPLLHHCPHLQRVGGMAVLSSEAIDEVHFGAASNVSFVLRNFIKQTEISL